MSKFEESFAKLKPVKGTFEKFGFVKKGKHFAFETLILDSKFKLVVCYNEKEGLQTEVFDVDFNEPFLPYRQKSTNGGFSQMVKREVEKVLFEIRRNCFNSLMFNSNQSQKVVEYIKKRRGDSPEHLWEKFPRYAVFRRQDNAKWYAGIFNLNAQKLGLEEDEEIEILIVRGNPEDVDGKTIFPGWHMNKKHWISLILDGRVPDEQVFKRIDLSYFFAGK